MKKIIVLVFLALSGASQAQCTAEAGPQVAFCADGTSNHFLDGQGGGQSPLTYSWTCEPVVWESGLIFYAHHLLSDTTNPQAQLTDPGIADSVLFYLQVSDGNGCVATDSVLVVFSLFPENFVTHSFNVTAGDSAFLDLGTNVFGGIEPLSYFWHPGSSLSDSTSLSFWASPESSTSYSCSVTDAMGCSYHAAPYYFVNVYNVGTEELEETVPHVIYNPSDKTITITAVSEGGNVKLFDASGKLRTVQKTDPGKNLKIHVKELTPGMYFLESGKHRKTIFIY